MVHLAPSKPTSARSEAALTSLVDRAPSAFFRLRTSATGVTLQDLRGGLLDALALSVAEIRADVGLGALVDPSDRDTLRQAFRAPPSSARPLRHDVRVRAPRSAVRWLRVSATPTTLEDDVVEWSGVVVDVTELKDAELLLAGQQRVLSKLVAGTPFAEVLADLVTMSEELLPDVLGSILLLDASGQVLRHAAAPSLPAAYIEGIDGTRIGPSVGSCGTAAFRNEPVIVSDIATDPLWSAYKHLALPHGLRACWSVPIRAKDGRVLGTFAMYYPDPRSPTREDWKLVELSTQLAAAVIEHGLTTAALAANEARLRFALEAARMTTWEWDARADVFTLASGDLVLGQGVGPIRGPLATFLAQVAPIDRDRVLRELQAMTTAPDTMSIEFRVVSPHGSLSWILCRGGPEPAAPAHGAVRGVMLDITARRAAEEALRESEERYRLLADNSTDIVTRLTFDGRIAYVSPVCEAVTGYSPAELFERVAMTLVLPADRDRVRATLRVALTTSEVATVAYRVVRKDGRLVWLETSFRSVGKPSCTSCGAPCRALATPAVIATSRDVTTRKTLEEQFLKAQKMEVVGRLAGGVAHDFNNLLTIVFASAELLACHVQSNPEARRLVRDVVEASERGAALTRRLLAFGRRDSTGAGRIAVNDVIFGIKRMIDHVLGENVELELALADGLPLLPLDAARMEQVLMNLVVNARDAIPERGRLTIETRWVLEPDERDTALAASPTGYVLLRVRDTGIGMDEGVKAHLFEPFFTTKGPGKGTGLGLATIHTLVAQAGGFIVVESAPGEGSEFRVYLPACGPGAVKELPPPAPPEPVPSGRERVLLVEDDDAVRAVAYQLLRSLGYGVLAARDGVEALEVLAANDGIDLVVSDVVMPKLGGWELAERVRERYPKVKILLVSGHLDDVALAGRLRRPDIPVLAKPFTREALGRRVREVLTLTRPT